MKFKVLLKILIFVSIFTLLPLSNIRPVKAATDFEHIVSANYVIKEDNSAHVEYHFKTTNKLSNNYLRSYTFNLPFEPLNLTVNGSKEALKVKNLKKANTLNTYELELEFSTPIYGVNKTFEWSFSFDVKGVILDHGMQKAIILPTFAEDESFSSYNISVVFPKTFGSIAYIYGNAGVQENELNYYLSFVSTRNLNNSILILIGGQQEYEFKVDNLSFEKNIPLPPTNDSQKVFYTDFPEREILDIKDNDDKYFKLKPQETLRGIISTYKIKNANYEKTDFEFPENETLNSLIKNADTKSMTKSEIAKWIFEDILRNFSVKDYRISKELEINLDQSKTEVNSEELNYIYRYLLNKFDIESRGTYGFVFPIQPFKVEVFKTDIQIWTEIWDGTEWISADPVWYISSRGTSYFNNNNFHHIKFGNYQKLDDIKEFFDNATAIKIVPLEKKSDIVINEKLEVKIEPEVYINKELKVKITNSSNYPLKLNNIFLNIKNFGRFDDINMTLFPNSSVSIAIPLDYNLIVLNQRKDIKLDIVYKDDAIERTATTESNILIPSNISSYLSIIIFSIFIIFSLGSVLLLSFYKKKIK
jgi:hypothetical protein